jgi:ATP-dependent Zn protease
MAALVESEVQGILQEARAIACGLLTEHHGQLVKLAEMLIQYEQQDCSQIEAVLRE